MTYTIVGTGNMAWFLGERLSRAGFKCRGVYGRDRSKTMDLAQHIKAPILTDLHELKDNTDFCVLAVADKAIYELAERLSFRDTVLIHTAGSVTMDALSRSRHRAVFWPVYSIIKEDLPAHRKIPSLWEANTDLAREVTANMAAAITDVTKEATDAQRQWMHLTAVLANNFINHIMALAEAICSEQELPFSFIQPILKQTFGRIEQLSPVQAQTGPARRHDQLTINQHLKLLQ
jgi:predicted short-subunit dehydrogenase-like oxidoreductase (DUF2520 family)